MCGIYKITNKINHKVYIGQAIDIRRRWKAHHCDPFNQNSNSYNYPLYCAIRKYGIRNFIFEVLEECEIDKLNEREIFYIAQYNANGTGGYNQTAGGNQSHNGNKLTESLVLEIIHRLKTSMDNSEIIGAEFKVSSHLIRGINRGDYFHMGSESYPIRQHLGTVKHKEMINHCERCGREIHRSARLCVECSGLAQRKSERPEPLELARMIKEVGFRNVGKQFGVSDNAVKNWCDAYGIPRKRKDLISWYNQQLGIIEPPKPPKKKPEDYMKPVKQIDIETREVITMFKSISDAARAVGCIKNPSHISNACRNHNVSHGYLWEFA